MEFKATWPMPSEFILERERKHRDPFEDLHLVPGFTEADLDEMAALTSDEVTLSTSPGSVGKGASGYGIDLAVNLLQTGEHILALIQGGEYVLKVIRWVKAKTGAEPTIRDSDTLGAVAAASADQPMRDMLTGCRFVHSVPMTTSGGSGTDARDVWAACFDGDGYAVVIFLSPTGLVLGTVTVPAEFALIDEQWRQRSAEEIAAWWATGGSA